MDCVEGMKLLDNGSVDLVVTSPPYDDLRTYKGYSFDFEATVKQLFRVIKNGGVVVWVVGDQTIDGDETGTSFKHALYFKEIGFKLFDTMIYKKRNGLMLGSLKSYMQKFEYMFVFSKGVPETINLMKDRKINYNELDDKNTTRKPDGSKKVLEQKILSKESVRSNVWEYLTGIPHSTKDKIAYNHPAIFPEQLAIDHILSWSNMGDLVLDPFMGSGTTGVACVKNSRNFIGFDISQEYCELAKKRISKYQTTESIPILNSEIL